MLIHHYKNTRENSSDRVLYGGVLFALCVDLYAVFVMLALQADNVHANKN